MVVFQEILIHVFLQCDKIAAGCNSRCVANNSFYTRVQSFGNIHPPECTVNLNPTSEKYFPITMSKCVNRLQILKIYLYMCVVKLQTARKALRAE